MIDLVLIALVWIIMILGILGAIGIPCLAIFIWYIAYTDNKKNGWVYRSLNRMIAQEAIIEKKLEATKDWRTALS